MPHSFNLFFGHWLLKSLEWLLRALRLHENLKVKLPRRSCVLFRIAINFWTFFYSEKGEYLFINLVADLYWTCISLQPTLLSKWPQVNRDHSSLISLSLSLLLTGPLVTARKSVSGKTPLPFGYHHWKPGQEDSAVRMCISQPNLM